MFNSIKFIFFDILKEFLTIALGNLVRVIGLATPETKSKTSRSERTAILRINNREFNKGNITISYVKIKNYSG
jgi:hypothetical protein